MKPHLAHILSLILSFSFTADGAPRIDREARHLLGGLDGYLGAREVYEGRKLDRLDAYRRLLREARDDRKRIDLCMDIADEFFSYRFDSTQAYLRKALELSEAVQDVERGQDAGIRLGRLYVKSGNYMEAYDRLYVRIDTATLSPRQKEDYFYTLFEFSRDLAGNSGMVERLSIPDRETWRNRLLAMLPQHSARSRFLRMDAFRQAGAHQAADSLGSILAASVDQENRDYAVYAYEMAESAALQGCPDRQMEWLVRSAECDIVNAVKDYASLTVIAQMLVQRDVDRSFRYLRIAQMDALAYNSKLRPWQISQFFLDIEDAYQARQGKMTRQAAVAAWILALLVAALILALYFLLKWSRKLSQTRAELQESNRRQEDNIAALHGLNDEISRSNAVQKAHILAFLDRMSENVGAMQRYDNNIRNLLKQGKADQLLKEVSISTRVEDELDTFYHTFDSTFLALYPDFVEDFNALLQPQARIVPKRGELLTTELRIFALILLGIEDSKKIASLLHYSVSTIYNYKVAVKNAAAGDRDAFEDAVKALGK